jgi:hypothetical protein
MRRIVGFIGFRSEVRRHGSTLQAEDRDWHWREAAN